MLCHGLFMKFRWIYWIESFCGINKTEWNNIFQNFKSKDIEANICKYYKSLGLQSRTTSYSCSKDDDEYDETLLLNRPLPWVVRVFFQYENSIKGILCSGKAFKDPIDSLSDRPEFSDIMMTFKDNLIFLFEFSIVIYCWNSNKIHNLLNAKIMK